MRQVLCNRLPCYCFSFIDPRSYQRFNISDNVTVSQLKERLVSLKKYQYVLLARPRSKWNKSGLYHVERRTHRHGSGWRCWVENKAFFEQILISNVHSFGWALLWLDHWKLFCLPNETHWGACSWIKPALVYELAYEHPLLLHLSLILAGGHILFGVLVFLWQGWDAITGDGDERNHSSLFSLLSKIVVLGRQPLAIIAAAGSGICLSCSWFTQVSVP